MAVLFQRALCAFPPFLVVRGGNDIRGKKRLDAIGGRLSAKAFQGILHQGDGIFPGSLPQGIKGIDLLHLNMIGRNRRERFGRIGVLHDMALLALEINDNAAIRRIPLADAAEAPAPVKGVGAGGEKL